MRRYLATLHQRPDHHKKHFALAVSSGFTLIIFAFWSLATFGQGGLLASGTEVAQEEVTYTEVSPLESLRSSMASSFEALRDNFTDLKKGFNDVDLKSYYEDLRDGALESYE